jgi:hypothetical protein
MTLLVAMSEGEYSAVVLQTVADYAAGKVTSGEWQVDESLELGRQGFP